MKEPKLVMGEYKGRPSLELRVEKSKSCFWKGVGTVLILGATAYFTHGGIANNNYCGWQKGTPLKEDVKMAYKQIDEVVIEPAKEAWNGLYELFSKNQSNSDNGKNSNEGVYAMGENTEKNTYEENPEKTARERAGIFLDKLQDKVRTVRDEKIISTINEAESNARFVNELYNRAVSAGEEKILELISTMGEDNVMKLVEEAAGGNKEVQYKLMRCIGAEQVK